MKARKWGPIGSQPFMYIQEATKLNKFLKKRDREEKKGGGERDVEQEEEA